MVNLQNSIVRQSRWTKRAERKRRPACEGGGTAAYLVKESGDAEIQHRQQKAQRQPPESPPKAQYKAGRGSELDVTAAHAFRLDQGGNQQGQGRQHPKAGRG